MSAKEVRGDDLVFSLGVERHASMDGVAAASYTKGGITKRELFALAFAMSNKYDIKNLDRAWAKADAFIAAGNGEVKFEEVKEKQT